jgi:VWFA-related protein
MKYARLACGAVLAATGTLVSIAAQQPSRPAFRTDADLVLVDAVVVNKAGEPIADLTAADFEVRDEGTPQRIELFQAVHTPEDAPALEPRTTARLPYSTNVGSAARVARAFVLFFDDVHLTREDGDRAKQAMTVFLDRETRPGDLVSVVAPGRSLRWHARMPDGRAELMRTVSSLAGAYAPDLSTERMSDYEAYRIHVFQDEAAAERVDRRWKNFRVLGREPTDLASDRGFQPQNRGGNIGIIKQDIAVRAAALYAQVEARNRATLLALDRTVGALASVRGRKSLVLVSPGFIEDQERREGGRVLDGARRANVAVYFVDARGLVTGSPYGSAQFGSALDARDVAAANADVALEAEGAENLSSQSGGFSVRNANDLGQALRRIGRESHTYYLLGFQPGRDGQPGAFRRLDVRVNRPGVSVRARRGYIVGGAAGTRTDGARDPDPLTRAADSPYDLSGIPLRAAAFVFGSPAPDRALTLLAVEADLRAFSFKPDTRGELSDTLQLRVVVTEQATGAAERYERDVEMRFPPGTRVDAESWRNEVAEFRLAPGRYQARFALAGRNNGSVGAVTHEFDVPRLTGLRVSTPIVTDTIETPTHTSSGPPRPVLVVGRTFPVGAMLYYQFNVFGVGGAAARVSADHEIRRSDGSILKRMEPRPIAPAADGALSRFSGVSLAGAPAADYELVIRVIDETTQQRIELHEPFTLRAPTRGDGAP